MIRTDTLAARALDAYEASRLEAVADGERRAEADRERMVAAAGNAVRHAFGPDAIQGELEGVEIDGRPLIVAHVAGAALVCEPQFPKAVRGLVACPLCGRPDCRTDGMVNNLERLGQLLAAPETYQLVTHHVDGDDCNGTVRTPRPEARQQWTARFATTGPSVTEKLNELDSAGYEPHVVPNGDGAWLVVGHYRHRHDKPVHQDDPF